MEQSVWNYRTFTEHTVRNDVQVYFSVHLKYYMHSLYIL